MGRARHCTPEEGRIILEFRSQNKTYAFIAKTLKRSPCVIAKVLKERDSVKPPEKRGRPRKTTKKLDNLIARQALKDPFSTSVAIKQKLRLSICARTI